RVAARALRARRAPERACAGRLDARRLSADAANDARRDRWVGRGLPALLRGHRPLLSGSQGGLGTLVRPGCPRHARVRGGDRRAVPVASHVVACAGHGPLRPQASRAPARAVSEREQYARQADAWTERAYADVGAYLAHRAELITSLGPSLEPGDEVLDLACGDGGLGEALVARGLRYRGVDSTPEMIDAARRRLRDRAVLALGDLNDYVPPAPVAATTLFRAIYYPRD